MKKFLKSLFLKHWSDFEVISHTYYVGNPFQKLFAKFQSVRNMSLVNLGYLHDMDVKKFLKNFVFIVLLLQNNNDYGPLKIQVRDPGPSWHSCFLILYVNIDNIYRYIQDTKKKKKNWIKSLCPR